MTREKVGSIREQCGNLCVELGDILNEYFASVFTVGKDDVFFIHFRDMGVAGQHLLPIFSCLRAVESQHLNMKVRGCRGTECGGAPPLL